MSDNREDWREPAGVKNSGFKIENIRIAKSENMKNGDTKTQKGPKLNKENIILSSQLKEGVTIQAYEDGKSQGEDVSK